MCGASSQDRTDHLILTMDTLYLLSYGSINGVVDRIRTCMSHKGLLAFQASAPPAERLRHFGVRPRTRTGTSLTRLLEIFKTSALPIRLRRTYLATDRGVDPHSYQEPLVFETRLGAALIYLSLWQPL